MDKVPYPKTLTEAIRLYAEPDTAHDFVVSVRWPNGVGCPRMGCGSMNVHFIATRRTWRCNDCKRQFSTKVGTIFEDSPLGYDKWLPAVWLITNAKNGISSCEIARGLGVTQKTAWFMLHRIRAAMKSGTFEQLAGPVEADETYIGGYTRGVLKQDGRLVSRGPRAGKTIVMGIMERRGRVRAFVVPSTQGTTLQDKIVEHVKGGATVYTDALASYTNLRKGYAHHVINHAVEYVNGHIHTNSIESFWSVFKRTIKGTYIAPRPWHLQRYVEEQVHRFNERKTTDGERFPLVVKQAEGVRVTYKALTGSSPTWRLKPGRARKSARYAKD